MIYLGISRIWWPVRLSFSLVLWREEEGGREGERGRGRERGRERESEREREGGREGEREREREREMAITGNSSAFSHMHYTVQSLGRRIKGTHCSSWRKLHAEHKKQEQGEFVNSFS